MDDAYLSLEDCALAIMAFDTALLALGEQAIADKQNYSGLMQKMREIRKKLLQVIENAEKTDSSTDNA